MLKKNLEKAMKEMGYYTLRPVQEIAYAKFKENTSFALQAKTGAGKTVAFVLPCLEQIDKTDANTQILMISPTRELALQTASKTKQLASYTTIPVITCIGGIPIDKQINALRHRPQVIIGTPGRLLDVYTQGYIHLDHVKRVILDEADQILSTGQQEETNTLLSYCHCPIALFSATITSKVKSFLPEGSETVYLDDSGINSSIETYYYQTEEKLHTLFHLLKTEDITSCIIFVSHKTMAAQLANTLKKRNILCAPFSSAYNERKRISVVNQFKKGELRVLVATDAMARGMDIQDVSHIIHYELPEDTETLIHRSGRTAHNNNEGTTIVLLNAHDTDTKVGKYCLENFMEYTVQDKKISTLTKTIEKEEEKRPQVTQLLIRCGRKDKIRPKDIIGALCTVIPFEKIGTLEIQDTYSIVTIHQKTMDLKQLKIKGKPRKIELRKE